MGNGDIYQQEKPFILLLPNLRIPNVPFILIHIKNEGNQIIAISRIIYGIYKL